MKKVVSISLAVLLIFSMLMLPGCNRGEAQQYPPGTHPLQPYGTNRLIDAQPIAAQRTFNAADSIIRADPIVMRPVSEVLYGQIARDGYILAPSMFGLSGIDSLSPFVLQTPADYVTLPPITIDGQPDPTIIRESSNTFIVTPSVALTPNSVYIFRLNRDESDITWAFQTAVRFEIASTLPRNQSTNVPVRTGIEIAFSFGREINIQDHFSIYPHVEGRFTYRDSTTIFMPSNPLRYGQIYTVTVSAGVGLPGISEIITTDHRFSFETAPENVRTTDRRTASRVHFLNRFVEFPSFTEPQIRFRVSHNRDETRPPVDFVVHHIENQQNAIAAVNRIATTPNWSQLNDHDRFVDTASLSLVHAETVRPRRGDTSWRAETLTLPNNLAPGFYVVSATTDDSKIQMIIQVTDLAVQIAADRNMALLWINDMTTGLAASGATVYDPISRETFEASGQGVAVVERMLTSGEYLIVTAADGKQHVVFVRSSEFQSFHGGWGWGSTSAANNTYWTALQLDRLLFQRSDTVSLWGFVQNRHQYEDITHVTAVLTESSWWSSRSSETLHMQNISVEYGTYSDEIRLPHLDPGSYEIAIFHGDILLNSIFFTVMDYVTPPYQLTVTPSASAIFAGEEITFSARTQFFEGTPVPDLDISYSFQGRDLTTPRSGQNQTDLSGLIEMTARPTAANADVQGERSLRFMAEATLPEIGWVNRSTHVRVFVNDIHVRPQAHRTGRNASLSVNVNDITLDRINDGTAAHWRDFLCAPTANQSISVEIREIYWERIRDGETYNHVTRQVVPRYRHERRVNSVNHFEITTDANGFATRDFSVPNRDRASYQARLTTTDGNGRTIVHYVFIGRDFTDFFRNANDDRLFLDGANSDGYDLGDRVELTIMRGTEPVTQGNFMFVVVQNGILSYHVGTNPLSVTFDESHVPNARVFAFHFNGHTYNSGWQMSQRLRFNPQERIIDINISSSQDAYRPGDEVTFTVTTTDIHGNRIPANVNISLVDEALFALMDYDVDTLSMLYRNVSDHLRFSMATHRTFISDGIDEDAEEDSAPLAAAAAPAAEAAGDSEETRIRERFEDTAVFASVRTDARGQATFSFELPDNITSWRITASAISNDLYAGNTVENLRVTQPMFLHYSLSSTFLVGDRPYVGVNAYGTSLSGGEQVTFEVWREDFPDDIRRGTGASFARVNIPLWDKNTQGSGALVIQASVAGYSDAIRHNYTVLTSHRLVDSAVFYDDVGSRTVFEVNPGGLTDITFTDRGRGQFLKDLFAVRNVWWGGGARIEGYVARREASRLIEMHFPDIRLFGASADFDALEYQTERGGIAILPYAEADLYTTVMLLPFIRDDVNLVSLKHYLRGIYNSSATDNKMLALYGLAMLGDPVLLSLHRYAQLDNLSIRNTAYIALGFAALGEMQAAHDLYTSNIAPHLQQIAPYYRINAGENRAEVLDATSAVALLSAQLGLPESLGLHHYAMRHRFDASNREDVLLMSIQQLKFISYEIANHTAATASITYTLFGETITRNLGRGRSFTLRIPAQNIREFNIVSTTGDVGAVSIVRTPLEDVEIVDNDITISREFFRAGSNTATTTFAQGDLVRVQITVDYSAVALSGSYVVTDFLPAGLTHVPNSARVGDRAETSGRWAHARTQGQRITFFDFNGRFDRQHIYYYYARVINPGTFTSEGVFVQNLGARQYMTVGENTVITINAN
ncbi:MAG: Ig-like domain-containing protein [Oscillospiraceae bacterium]|nr:Ig-like domain-containing protein [Oscillospiraceae bacterium]